MSRTSLLLALSPGSTVCPCSPPKSIESRLLMENPPLRLSPAWHRTHDSSRIGFTC